jgi:hypothetical protein
MFEVLLTARRNHQAEGVGVLAVVKSEAELVHVERQIFLADLMVGSDDPALEQAPKVLNRVGMDATAHVFTCRMGDDFVRQRRVAFAQEPITGVFISRNEFDLIANGGADKLIESRSVGILDNLRDHHALAYDCSDDRDFTGSPDLTGSLAAMLVCGLPADKGFINLDFASQREGIALHRSAPAMADVPSSAPVRAGFFAEDDAPNLQRTHTFLRSQHEIADFEPEAQRNLGILEDRPGHHREAIALAPAAIRIATSPMEGTRLERIDLLSPVATWAARAVRPALRNDVFLAGFISREGPVELLKGHHAKDCSSTVIDCQYQQNCLERRGQHWLSIFDEFEGQRGQENEIFADVLSGRGA